MAGAKKKAVKKAAPPKPPAHPASETEQQQDRVIAKLMAEHGYSFEAASMLVKASKPAGTVVVALKPSIGPDDDHVKTVTVDFQTRAGVTDYALEMKERLQDLEERKSRVFYVLPVRLTKKLYRFLLQDALREGNGADYTEENHIETILLERMAIVDLTAPPVDE